MMVGGAEDGGGERTIVDTAASVQRADYVDVQAQPLLDHSWKHFQLHAAQRISVFNFFVVLSGLGFAGLAGTFQLAGRRALLGLPVGLLLAAAAFIFWKLDQRCAWLIKQSEGVMADAERLALPVSYHLFANSKAQQVERGHWTYGRSFRTTFAIMAVVGLGGAAVSLLRGTGHLTWPD